MWINKRPPSPFPDCLSIITMAKIWWHRDNILFYLKSPQIDYQTNEMLPRSEFWNKLRIFWPKWIWKIPNGSASTAVVLTAFLGSVSIPLNISSIVTFLCPLLYFPASSIQSVTASDNMVSTEHVGMLRSAEHSTALHNTALNYTLYCTVLLCTALHCTALNCITLICIALYSTEVQFSALFCIVQHYIGHWTSQW